MSRDDITGPPLADLLGHHLILDLLKWQQTKIPRRGRLEQQEDEIFHTVD